MGNSIYESQARKVFDYNQFRIKILTGVRGAGKTYPVHEHILNKYFKKGEYFVLVRETQEEVDNMLAARFGTVIYWTIKSTKVTNTRPWAIK